MAKNNKKKSDDVAGVETPVAGVETPVAGVETPIAGVETPIAGVETPIAGVETPVADDGLPVDDDDMPVSDDDMPVSDDGLPVADGDGEDGEGVMLETEDIGTVDEEAVKNLVETYLSASVASRRAFLKQIGLQKEKGKRGRTAIYHATCPEMQVAMQMWNYGIHNVSVIAGVLTNMEVWSVWIRNRFKLPTSKISQATLAKLLKEQKCEIHKAGRGNSMTTYSKLGAFATQCKDETVAAAAESAAAAAEANTESAAA